ncbi:MAG: nicotinamide-nucleotide amidohydrolase family protein [Aquiluna sp.]|nr:nicotinamide-nucleotide amidohydrolase family protein [Aquiluna sp.]
MAEQVIKLCGEQQLFIATAESLTGGLVASELASISGASKVLLGSVVAYQNSIKQQLLGVSGALIANQSAVDPEVCAQMAQGIREKFAKASGLDVASVIGLSTTGVAGPESVSGHEAGEVFIGISSNSGVAVFSERFFGSRNEVRRATVERSIEILREHLSR